ncbi:MAG: hypothetical protein GY799_19620 [Desulfobulbaceae bacterium]|nr:hypothetical protein [Desulfobulbaceae bacterium]
MMASYIKPESLTLAEVQLVLDFLNGAQTIEEIADTIEIVGELDVGLRVARRLLDRRDAVGGAFTNIQQVADTPYVGPERFTEIVAVLTGRSIQRVSESGAVQQAVLQELHELREMVRSLLAKMNVRYRVSMRLGQAGLYLGQSAIILIEVRDGRTNKRRANIPITMATSWGSLQTYIGFEKRHGSVITAQTDINGTAKIEIIGPTYEKLTDAQQLALDSALRILDPAAPTPDAVAAALDNLVSMYQANGSVALRQAMDIYFNTRRETLASAINPPSSSFAWPYFDALITAYVHDDEQQHKYGNVVESTAVLKVRVKDWMDPWYQTYIKNLSEGSTISEDFKTWATRISDTGLLLNNMVDHLYSYSSSQFGSIGKSVAEKVVQNQVNHFLSSGLPDLPFDTSRILYPALKLAGRNITTSQMGTLTVVGQVRQDLNKNLDTKIDALGDIGAYMEEITSVQGQLDQFQTDYGQFQTDIGQFNHNYGQFENNFGQFETNYANFQDNLGFFNSKYTSFTTAYTTFTDNYSQFDSNYTVFSEKYDDFNSRERTFNTSLTNIDSKLTGFNKNYANFTAAYSGFNDNMTRFTTNFTTFNRDYTNFQEDIRRRG